ncbi:MAG: YggS family pyridoxal phosphate-dependent enzyme [Xanthomonadales bacterium]|nr:YggS family pyridoxal phosphate-dependent enzyme [Xanthomonadales bacterium]
MSIEAQYRFVLKRIQDSCEKNRIAHQVDLLAVSKKQLIEKIKELYHIGHRKFGESYVQEAVEKIELLRDLEIEWHFIGPIQSNKTKYIAKYFDWVQSVDSKKILTRLNNQRPEDKQLLNVLLQLKVGNEESKSGCSEEEIFEMIKSSSEFAKLKIRGLMCIPPPAFDEKIQKEYFQYCYNVFKKLQMVAELDTLSMGMSNDLESAIACQTTMVRVGTDVFGARD